MDNTKFSLLSFTGKMKTLHLSWMAFFITFVVWFNFAPLLQMVKTSLGLSTEEIKTLLILNVALTIPARVAVGMLTDRYGPRLVYSSLLAVCSIPCFMFAMADSFIQAAIARFLLGFIGAGFVVEIPDLQPGQKRRFDHRGGPVELIVTDKGHAVELMQHRHHLRPMAQFDPDGAKRGPFRALVNHQHIPMRHALHLQRQSL